MRIGWEVVAAAISSTLTNIAATQVDTVRNLSAVMFHVLSKAAIGAASDALGKAARQGAAFTMTAANGSTKAQMIDENNASGDETTITLWTRSHRRVTLLR